MEKKELLLVFKKEMADQRISMSRLAKMTDMPSSTIYRAFASNLESARLLTIKKIADALGLSIDEMLCE